MKCIHCGSQMTTKLEDHHYTGSGLQNVVLLDMEVSRCTKCDTVEVAIPAIGKLHAMLAVIIANSTAKLSPEQIRFLRKHLGWSSIRFAQKMGCERTTVYRWEAGDSEMPLSAQRLLRVLVQHENPVVDYARSIELERMGIDEPLAQMLAARMKNGSWLPAPEGDGHKPGHTC